MVVDIAAYSSLRVHDVLSADVQVSEEDVLSFDRL